MNLDLDLSCAIRVLRVQMASGVPVHAENVPKVWFPASTSAFIKSYTRDYAIRFSSLICFARPTKLKFRLCTDNSAQVSVNNIKVRIGSGEAPCVQLVLLVGMQQTYRHRRPYCTILAHAPCGRMPHALVS